MSQFRTRPAISLAISQLVALPPRRFSSISDQTHSFATSYLVNSLGFSERSALSASRLLNFKTPEKPDNVVRVFKVHGFTRTQISDLVRRYPRVLASSAEKTLFPKFEFFKSKGFTDPEMAKMFASFPALLRTSLDHQIIPTYGSLWRLFSSDEGKVVYTIKRHPIILGEWARYTAPNIEALRDNGVPSSNIAKMVRSQPRSFAVTNKRFSKTVEDVNNMGFDQRQMKFVYAVVIRLGISERSWLSKVEVFKRFGFSEEEVTRAFVRDPRCMAISERKIVAGMDFFAGEMGWSSSHIAKRLVVLGLSLRKRIVPRCSVYKTLISKGLVKNEVGLSMLFSTTEKDFLSRFVEPYKKVAPELLNLYKKTHGLENCLVIE